MGSLKTHQIHLSSFRIWFNPWIFWLQYISFFCYSLTGLSNGSTRAAKMVRCLHSHVVKDPFDSLGTSIQPFVPQIAGSSGRQNTHRFCEVVFTFQRLHKSRKFVRLFSSMDLCKRLAKSLQQQLETKQKIKINNKKNLRKQYKYSTGVARMFSMRYAHFSKSPCPPRGLPILLLNIMGEELLLNFGAKF